MSLSVAKRRQYAQQLAQNLIQMPEVQEAHSVLSYAPTQAELDPNCFAALLTPAPLLVFPRVAENCGLSLHSCEPQELLPGAYNILEPQLQHPRLELTEIQVVLLPGLAFDRQGHRLGYGKGYYDRLLKQKPAALTLIGICYDETLFDEIATEAHDVSLDFIVTPSQSLRTGLADNTAPFESARGSGRTHF
jgi:5-formyltetrahydrofolate cyclo-ligase